MHSGKYIDIPNGQLANGKEIQLYESTESTSQLWGVYNEKNGFYTIRSEIDKRYMLSVQGDIDVNGAKIVLKYVPNGSAVPNSALFQIIENRYGCAGIVSKLSIMSSNRKAISCQKSETANGTLLVQNATGEGIDGSQHQLWVFESPSREPSYLTWSLVDSGSHCDWDGSTKYSSIVAKATKAWNGYIDREVFRPDAWNRIQDVYIKDVAQDPTGKNLLGRTYSGSLSNGLKARTIELYTNRLDNLSSDLYREKTIMHELGHALGLDHSPPEKNDKEQGIRISFKSN